MFHFFTFLRVYVLPRRSTKRSSDRRSAFVEQLESREMLYGYITAQNDGPYNLLNTSTLNVAAPGVLANDYDSQGLQMTAVLSTQPAHGSVTLNGDGSFWYTANAGFTVSFRQG